MKSRRAKATDISQAVKAIVWERDGGRCILCGSRCAMPNAHYISRARGGLGVEQNIVTLCTQFAPNRCHDRYDNGTRAEREEMRQRIWAYLQTKYPGLREEDLIFRKWE